MNLIATTDAAKKSKILVLFKLNHAIMGKCSTVWYEAGKPKSSKIINTVICKQLRCPCATTWNSMYDSILQLQQLGSKINTLMQKFKLPVFKENELKFLKEYPVIMKPIFFALDKLQKEQKLITVI